MLFSYDNYNFDFIISTWYIFICDFFFVYQRMHMRELRIDILDFQNFKNKLNVSLVNSSSSLKHDRKTYSILSYNTFYNGFLI